MPIALDHTTPLNVVYEDADFIAVNKAVGFHTAPVHRWQDGSIVNILLAHFSKTAAAAGGGAADAAAGGGAAVAVSTSQDRQQQQQQQSQESQPPRPSHVAAVKPYVLHRLDYNTSGLLLFGKRREVVPGVGVQFRWVTVDARLLLVEHLLCVPAYAALLPSGGVCCSGVCWCTAAHRPAQHSSACRTAGFLDWTCQRLDKFELAVT